MSGGSVVPPTFDFTYDSQASPFTVSSQAFVDSHADAGFQYIGTGALVFDTTDPSTPRVLLIQRSASDSMPNLWEIPGGGCDAEDRSILHAVARELWEEAGLQADHIGAPVGGAHLFTSRSGKRIGKYNFVVRVQKDEQGRSANVKLNPEEHQRFLWATKREARDGKVGDVRLNFAAKELELTILQAFDGLKGQ